MYHLLHVHPSYWDSLVSVPTSTRSPCPSLSASLVWFGFSLSLLESIPTWVLSPQVVHICKILQWPNYLSLEGTTPKKCIIRQFCHCINIMERTHTGPSGLSDCTPRLSAVAIMIYAGCPPWAHCTAARGCVYLVIYLAYKLPSPRGDKKPLQRFLNI